ncbi:MAG: hemolysin III family protein [Rhodopila sp.]
MTSAAPEFPHYTAAETAADAVIHVLGLAGASVALGCLLARIGSTATGTQLAALIVYGLGLVGMLSASALYNLTPPRAGRLKRVFRHLDHAMIFVMIAGSYTPVAISALPRRLGLPLCATVWSLAAIGIGLRLMWGHIYQRLSLGLHLAMGWLVLAVLPPLAVAVSGGVLACLILGGIVYSLGSVVHTWVRVPFHNAAWHIMVIVAAALHLAAVADLLS